MIRFHVLAVRPLPVPTLSPITSPDVIAQYQIERTRSVPKNIVAASIDFLIIEIIAHKRLRKIFYKTDYILHTEKYKRKILANSIRKDFFFGTTF